MVDDQTRFVTDASHELRTPLTSLKSEIEVNLRDKTLNLAQAKKSLRSNLEDVNHLQRLTDELIKLTQYQKGGKHLKMARISLQETVKEAISKVNRQALKKRIVINNRVGDFCLFSHQPSLVELLVILLDNAVKYSPKDKSVNLTSQKIENHLLLSVTDQGVGVKKDDLPYLFDRFYRADKSRSKNVQGYGLGLSIAQKITTRLGGSIEVKSRPSKGSVFTVQLPLNVPKD